MKQPSFNPFFSLAVAALLTGTGHAAQTYQDANALNTWNATDANWDSGVVWANTTSSDAIFGGTGETVTVTTVNARDITFNSNNYTLTGSTITLGGASNITVTNSTDTAIIPSILAGAATSLTKSGAGKLTLSGNDSYTGETIVSNGILYVDAGGTSASSGVAPKGNLTGTSKITVNNGGILEFGGSSTTNATSGANSIGTNSKPITVNAGGTLKISGINAMGYWNLNQYARITLNGGNFAVNYNQYIGSLTIGTGGTVTGAGIIQLYYAAPSPDTNQITANDDATIACGIGLDNSGTTKSFSVASGKTLNISGKISNFNGGNSTTLIGFTKTGAGTLLLSNNTNNYSGPTVVSSGTLKLGAAGALGVGATNNGTSVSSGAVLDLNGQAVASEALTLNGTGISSGGALINSSATPATVGAGAITIASATSIGGSGNITLAGAITGTVDLTKTGSGTLFLSALSTGLTGNTFVNQGTLTILGDIRNSNVTVADGAALGASNPTASALVNNLVLGSASGGALRFGVPSQSIYSLDAIDLTVNGTTAVHVAGSLQAGTYKLLTCANRLGTGTFTIGSLPRGVVANLVDNTTTLDLNVSGVSSTIWKGTAGSAWDINSTQNWKLAATDPDVYMDGDNVVFDGTATSTNVTLGSGVSVAPSSVTFNFDSPASYSLSGSGSIVGTTGITKTGTGALTLGTVNTFSGAVALNGGSILLGSASALGSTAGGTTVADGTTLDLNGQVVGAEAVSLDGSLLNNSANPASLSGAVTLAGDAIAGGSGNLALTGIISGTAALEKSGTGILSLNQTNTYTGATTVTGGTLSLDGGGGGSGTIRGSVTVSSGATLRLNSTDVTGYNTTGQISAIHLNGGTMHVNVTNNQTFGNCAVNLTGGTITGIANSNLDFFQSSSSLNSFASGTSSTISGPFITIRQTAGLTVTVEDGAAEEDLVVNSVIRNNTGFASAPLTKAGAGKLVLKGINTHTGNTVVNAGTLVLADNARLTFKIGATSGTTNTLSGAGTVVLDGDFAIDTTAAAALTTGSWVLENVASLTGAYGSSFTVVNPDGSLWTNAGSDKWTKPGAVSGTQWTFDEMTGTLTLTQLGYDAWKSQIGDTAQQGRDMDPDGDGFNNLQEFLFGTLPTASNASLVTTTSSGGSLTLRWLQRQSGASYSLKQSSTLSNGSWITPGSPVPAVDAVQSGAPADYQYFKVVVPIGSGKDFFRIEGVEN